MGIFEYIWYFFELPNELERDANEFRKKKVNYRSCCIPYEYEYDIFSEALFFLLKFHCCYHFGSVIETSFQAC